MADKKSISMKNSFMNGVLFVASVSFALLIGEVIVRVMEAGAPSRGEEQVLADDPYLDHKVAWAHDVDADGWRNTAIPEQVDIIAIGDSMTQGLGVPREEAWPQVLARLASTSVYQMALGGYGPVHYTHLTETSKQFSPRIVIVGFYLGNDLYDSYAAAYNLWVWKDLRDANFHVPEESYLNVDVPRLSIDGAPVGIKREELDTSVPWIRTHVRLYARMLGTLLAFEEKFGPDDREKFPELFQAGEASDNYTYVDEPAITTVMSPSYRFDTVDLDNPITKEGWRVTQERFLSTHGALPVETKFVIVAIPTKEAVYLDLMQKETGTIPEQFRKYKLKEDALQQAFLTFCDVNGITCFSLRPTLGGMLALKKPIYKTEMDGHPTALGYRAMAEGISGFLKGKGYIP